MKNIIAILFLVSLFIFQGCHELFDCCFETGPSNGASKISFTNLQIGQKSVYIRLRSKNWSKDSTFTATTDTIRFEVLSKDDKGFKVLEIRNGPNPKPVYFYFKISDNKLSIKPLASQSVSSSVFSMKEQLYLFEEQGLGKWTLAQGIIPKNHLAGPNQAYVEDLKINGVVYPKALGSLDASSIDLDGPYYVKLYTKENGFISLQTLGSFAISASVWNLIP